MNEIIIRNYLDSDFEAVKKLLNNILRLDYRYFPKQHINEFLALSAKKFIDDSFIKKVAILNNEIAGLAFFGHDQFHKDIDKDFLNPFETMLASLKDEKEKYDFNLQISVIKTIDILTNELKCDDKYKKLNELKLLSVDPKFKGKNISKLLINEIKNELNFNSFWLVTDSNCNWKYYESQGYKLVTKKQVLDANKIPFNSFENTPHEIMIFLKE